MTDYRSGQSYSRQEVAETAKAFHAATDIAPYALRHHYELLDIQGRTPDQTLEVFLSQCDTVPVIKTGPETGIAALSVHTHGEDSGLFALAKAGLFCFCSDPFIEVITAWNDKCMSHHVLHYRSGNRTFPRWAFESLPGVILLDSGEFAPISPGYSASCDPMCPSVDYAYGYGRDYATYGIPDLPTELIDRLELEQEQARHRERAKAAAKGVKHELFDPIPAGRRNTELTRRAGYLIGCKQMSEDAALEALLQINAERCQPPLNVREVEGIAHSIARRHERNG
jgi:hypothetical protein